ncbi:hypothetical protein C8F04DRAFT_1191155 [Mycena alexandri]|uniref:Uncharacterized protein n=1 Tax=Mycena alexandri TaxID=1745969 RepID=A0AAD6SDP6_9AGAR|nr:hypothetical protein C8F04DRAFT_1191155 [Mycena alexandri]
MKAFGAATLAGWPHQSTSAKKSLMARSGGRVWGLGGGRARPTAGGGGGKKRRRPGRYGSRKGGWGAQSPLPSFSSSRQGVQAPGSCPAGAGAPGSAAGGIWVQGTQ